MKIYPDENLLKHPVNSAIAYSWAAVGGNWKNSAVVGLALLALSLLQILPFVGFLFGVVQSLILYSMGYWAADRLKRYGDVDSFRNGMRDESERSIVFEFLAPASGFYVGFVLFSIVMGLITLAIFWLSGGFETVVQVMHPLGVDTPPEQIEALYAQLYASSSPAILFILITSLFFGYVWPLVYGYALQQRSFTDALNAVFMIFSTAFWKASFTAAYFKLVSVWMLVLLAAAILMGFTLVTFLLFPLFILILIWSVYFTSIVSAAAYNMSDDI